MNRSTLVITAVLALTLAAAAPAAHAQTDLDQPVASSAVLSLSGGGTVDGDTLHLPLDRTVELRVEGLDQYGRPFPLERFRFEFDMERDCRGLVELLGAKDATLTLRTGKGAGSCGVHFWLPNNLNADRRLRIVGDRGGSTGGTVTRPVVGGIDTQEELLAVSLFRAVLGREPDGEWVAAAVGEIRRNDTREVVRSLLGSQEFRERRGSRGPEDLLRDFYSGLLGREPDPAGVRRYRGSMHEGSHEQVILEILESREFRDRLDRETR